MPTGVSIVQLSILRALEREGPLGLSRLADNLVLERTSLYRTIEPLVDSGDVKITDADKGKSKFAELTSAGQKTIKRVMPYWEKAQERILNEVDSTNWQEMHGLMNAIARLSS